MLRKYYENRIQRINNYKHGFTLAELLVVVAIIAILVAISIPIFTSQLEKSRKATCDANRRSLKATMSTQYMNDGSSFTIPAADGKTTYNETQLKAMSWNKDFDFDGDKGFCPSGGTISVDFDGSSFQVYCSKHNPAYRTMADAMTKLLEAATLSGDHGMDSGALKGNFTPQLLAKLKAMGIDLGTLGAKTWRYEKIGGKQFFYWSPNDISKYAIGDDYPVMRYNMNTGTYTVWHYTVAENTLNGETYNYIKSNQDANKQDPDSKSDKQQTYESAKAIYDNLMH